jgi:hypothetical protein
MTDDVPADVATQDSAPKALNPATKAATRTKKAATTEKAPRPTRTKSKSTPKSTQQKDPEPGPSSSDTGSEPAKSDEDDDGGIDKSTSEYEEDDPAFHQPFKAGADPFSPEWYRTKSRAYLEEMLQVPGSHRNSHPRHFVIRDADFNRILANCSTGAKQEEEVLHTATAFIGSQLNRCNQFIEEHEKLGNEEREHLEENWLFLQE